MAALLFGLIFRVFLFPCQYVEPSYVEVTSLTCGHNRGIHTVDARVRRDVLPVSMRYART